MTKLSAPTSQSSPMPDALGFLPPRRWPIPGCSRNPRPRGTAGRAIKPRFSSRPGGGFTLLEVLVSLLILSVGLLGIAGLQLTGLRSNQSAYVRSQATILAYDILDRMRANRAEAQSGGYNITIAATDDLPSMGGSPTQAATDLNAWGTNLLALLPAVQTNVNVAADNTVTVSIAWDDSRADRASDRGGAPVTDLTQFQFQTEL